MTLLLLLSLLVLPPAAPVPPPVPVPVQDPDDALAKELAAVTRDPRLPVRARTEAARTLGKMGPRAAAAVPPLIQELERLRGMELEPLQEAIIDAFGQIGSPARTALPMMARAAGRSTDLDVALKRATGLILASSDTQDIDALTRQLNSADSSQRLRAVKALGNIGPAARVAVPNLLSTLSDTDADVRRAAVVALRLIQPEARPSEQVVRAIAADLQDADPAVRAATVRALARLGLAAAPALPAIEALTNDPDADVRRAVVDALARIGARP